MLFFVTIVAYVAALLGVGIWKSRSTKTQDDFMVAGRTVSTWYLVGTLVCTWIGSGSLFGGAGLAFREGIGDLWMSAGAWVGIVMVYFLAHRVRRIAQYTVADILEKRYTPLARVLGSLTITIAYTAIVGYQYRGAGRLLNLATQDLGFMPEIPVETGRLIACALVIVFTLLAGMVSIVSVDLFNGTLMVLGVLVGLPLALQAVGGFDQVAATVPATHFAVFGQHGPVWAFGVFFPTFFLLLGEGGMYQKFMSAKDEHAARRAVLGMVVGVVVIETSLALLAVVGAGKYWNLAPFRGADGALDVPATETIILYLARHDLPVVAGCILLGAGMAIIFSTANTFLMSPSTNLARDIYQRFLHPSASQRQVVLFQRAMIVVVGVTAYLLATQFTSILQMAFAAYTMVGAGLTPALLAAFLWKRVTPAGGTASIATGMLVTTLITVFQSPLTAWLGTRWGFTGDVTEYMIYPAVLSSIFCLVVVSLLTAPSPEARWRPFFDEQGGVASRPPEAPSA
ncbi:MAG TPA: sodium:solute symporter family protein [Vicinamibacteria bacterium]|nr:sodium:solute symporter family protein [Vicinamibacteria bacterium]